MNIPAALTDANVYIDGSDWLGKAEIELPSITFKMAEVKQFGVLGSTEVPLVGQIEKMEGRIKFKAINPDAMSVFYNPRKASLLDIRAAQQKYNTPYGTTTLESIKVLLRVFPKNIKMMNFKQGADEDSEIEYVANYYKLEIAGKEILEIDQYNYVYRINGADLIADLKSALGK